MSEPAKKVTKEEVAKHTSESDMWVIIHGRAFDVSKFADEHPGGREILAYHAGKDASDDFESTGHSSFARDQLKQYFVGDVEGMVQGDGKGGCLIS